MNIWQGERVHLRGIEPADAAYFFTWNQDSDRARHMDFIWPPGSLESVRQWVVEASLHKPQGDNILWVIENAEGVPVGSIDTHTCDRRVGTFRYGVAVAEEHRGKGYASEAILLVLRYFFDELRYQKVTVDVHSNNADSIRLHEKLGFQLEGRLRRMVYTQGQYFDGLCYGMTAEEFAARYGPEASSHD